MREAAQGDAGAERLFHAGATRRAAGNASGASKIQSAMAQCVQASVTLQLRQLAAAAHHCNRLDEQGTTETVHWRPTEAQSALMSSHFTLRQHSLGGVIEEASSLEACSDIDSLADHGWPDRMPHNTDRNEVVSSLAQNIANKHKADLRERARGAAAWNIRVAETHHRRVFLASPGGTLSTVCDLERTVEIF